jgi:hypothetical protein
MRGYAELNAGTFSEGMRPQVVVGNGLTHSNAFEFTVSNTPETTTSYTVVAVYPHGFLGDPSKADLKEVKCYATTPKPDSGVIGTLITISGEHFEGIRGVGSILFGPTPAAPLTVSVGGGGSKDWSSLTMVVPDVSNMLLPQKFNITIRSEWGDCKTAAGFTVTLPPPVKVPNLNGQSLQSAVQTLQQSGLLLGSVTAGSNAPTAIVQSQDRQPGAQIAPNTVVNVSTVGLTSITGHESLQLVNNLQSGHDLYVWLYDAFTGKYVPENESKLLAVSATANVSLPAGHFSIIYAVDPQNPQCGGRNDPTDTGACVVWQNFFFGSSGGGTIPVYMQ